MPFKCNLQRYSVVEGVGIWRPMLPHAKDPILAFAHTYGVPYFMVGAPLFSTLFCSQNTNTNC